MQHDHELKYFKDMAAYIKGQLDTKLGGAWHIVVGTHFGSFVSYEHRCITLFWLEQIGFLIYRHA